MDIRMTNRKTIPRIKSQLIVRTRTFQRTRVQPFQETATIKRKQNKNSHKQGTSLLLNYWNSNFRENIILCFTTVENYQWKYVRPPVLGTWRKNSKSWSVCLSSFTSKSSEEDAHFFTVLSQCPKSCFAGEAFTKLETGKTSQITAINQKTNYNQVSLHIEWNWSKSPTKYLGTCTKSLVQIEMISHGVKCKSYHKLPFSYLSKSKMQLQATF